MKWLILPIELFAAFILMPIVMLMLRGDDVSQRLYEGDEWPRYPKS